MFVLIPDNCLSIYFCDAFHFVTYVFSLGGKYMTKHVCFFGCTK